MLIGEAIVLDYVQYHRQKAQKEFEWFRQQPTLRSAIETAALAIDRHGNKYPHQWRLTRPSLVQAQGALLANAAAIKKCRNFDDLFTLVEQLVQPLWGIGPLYVYDTSLRIGAKLNLLPARVYLHAGTEKGLKALGLYGAAQSIDVSRLPAFLRQLEPHEIEDCLCLYKKWLGRAGEEVTEAITADLCCGSPRRHIRGC